MSSSAFVTVLAGLGFGFGSGSWGLLGPGVGFRGGSGFSSSMGVTAPFGMIPSSISSFGISIGVRGLVRPGDATFIIGALLSSQATSGASTALPLFVPPT